MESGRGRIRKLETADSVSNCEAPDTEFYGGRYLIGGRKYNNLRCDKSQCPNVHSQSEACLGNAMSPEFATIPSMSSQIGL